MNKLKNIKVFVMLSIIAFIAFAGCTEKNEQTSNTSQGDVQMPQGDVQISGEQGKEFISKCPEKQKRTTAPGGSIYEPMGIVEYEGKAYCLTVQSSPDGGSFLEQYVNDETWISIYKDGSGKIIQKSEQKVP